MTRRPAEGRYGHQAHAGAIMPANGLAKPPRTRNVTAVTAVVADPLEPGKRLLVSVNRHVDVLEVERSHGRLSEAAYRVGRELQAVFEAGSRIGAGSQWREGDRVDAELAKETAITRNVDIARAIDGEMRRLERDVGTIGAEFLREILSGTSFAEYAVRTTMGTKRDVRDVSARFRAMLEDIVLTRQARGDGVRRAVDKHDDAAASVASRLPLIECPPRD